MTYTITETKTLYTFDELSDEAKETAKSNLLQDPWYFWTDVDAEKSYIIDPLFPHARPEWQGDFSFCQGDGLNIYGDFSFNELRACANLRPVKEDVEITLKPNPRYTYCRWDMSYYGADILDRLSEEKGEAYAERQRANVARICDAVGALCSNLREYGEWLIFEGYLDPSVYDGQLFDEFGEYVTSR